MSVLPPGWRLCRAASPSDEAPGREQQPQARHEPEEEEGEPAAPAELVEDRGQHGRGHEYGNREPGAALTPPERREPNRDREDPDGGDIEVGVQIISGQAVDGGRRVAARAHAGATTTDPQDMQDNTWALYAAAASTQMAPPAITRARA
jgi:hypothetical protein